MLARALGLVVALSLAAACAQVRRVGKPEQGAAQDTPQAAGEQPASSRKKTVKAGPDRPPVPATPGALLDDGGAGDIQGALAAKGYLPRGAKGDALDAPTTAAIRKFQEDEGLAATGFPDRETLRRLGLDPQQVYRTTDDAAQQR